LKSWRDAPVAEQSCIARAWLAEFGETLQHQEYARAALMIHPDGYWRDLLTFGWIFKTLHGIEDVEAWLTETFDANRAYDFCLEGEPQIRAFGDYSVTLQFFFKFETETALGRGFVRLVESPNAPNNVRAFTVLTTMSALKAFPEATGRKRPRADLRFTSNESKNWLDRRSLAREFTRKDPDVIIIGGGQSGLMLAARLGQLNVSTLVVEKTDRVGDVWRNRYRSLTLHNEICMNHFAYMPFPDTWPVYIPKDNLANWLEFYAESMEVNVWTKTTFLGAEYENSAKRWNAQLRTADGSIRIMRPSHIVLAIGVSGLPNVPTLEGQDAFAGPIVHSSGHTDDLNVKGKSVLVVGAGTSGHDIAQDLNARGGDVTMLQRSSITVVSLEPSSVRPYELYRQNDGIRPIADTDLMAASVPYELLARLHKTLSRQMAEEDKGLLDGLRRVGFLLDNGEDDTGYFLKLLRHQAGYYLNVGASDLIIAGKIGLKAGVDINRLEKNKIIFSDGTSLAADIIVLATGYKPLQEGVRKMFGDEVAERVGPIWGIGDDGELCNMYARTAQEGLYVAGGGIPGARAYSQYTAFLIKAAVEGLLPSQHSTSQSNRSPKRKAESMQRERSDTIT
jgi:cation diffusion facilitator CzcD-associated flavoprotein CzcO